MSVQLIFSFDSEDYETPAADDAEKWWAETMSKHGITACTCVVGELARALRERGRWDVIKAMMQQEVAFHSNRHSAHPTWAEYLDEVDWDEGVAWAMREESKGIADVRDVFGQHPSAWCKPGASWGPQVAHAMRQMDVPVFCDSPFEMERGTPLWYDDNLFLMYHTSFDRYFSVPEGERLAHMQQDFEAICDAHDGRYLVMYTHPCRLFTAKFTDTFRHGKNPPREGWSPAPLRPREEIAALQQDFDAFLAWVVQQSQVELTTYRRLYAAYRPKAALWLRRDEVMAVAAQASEFNYQQIGEEWLSPAEQFGVLARAAGLLRQSGKLPDSIAVRRLLGPTETPPALVSQAAVLSRTLFDAAAQADISCTDMGRVPASIRIGGESIGPNAFMQALASLLWTWHSDGQVPKSVAIRPVSEYPQITERDDFRRQGFKGWTIFPPEFEGKRVLEMIRLQAWTAKPAGT